MTKRPIVNHHINYYCRQLEQFPLRTIVGLQDAVPFHTSDNVDSLVLTALYFSDISIFTSIMHNSSRHS